MENKEPIYTAKATKIIEMMKFQTRNEVAEKLNYKTWKSLDMYMRRKNFIYDSSQEQAINEAVNAAIEEGRGKFGGKIPNKAALKLPLRDGDIDRPDDEAYANSYFINANSITAPQIVDRNVNPILERSEVYSGVYARVSINFYAFNSNGNKGIACGLGNIQKIRDGEPLGGRTNAADDFATDVDDDFLS
jgi:hypothetical protein